MISFDVRSLFTNIPLDFVIDQILKKSFPDKKSLISWSYLLSIQKAADLDHQKNNTAI